MTKPRDETMKQLIDASPQELVDWLAPGGVFQEFVLTELVKPKEEEEPLRADRYLALEVEGQAAVLHLEIQSGPEARMGQRLLEDNFRFSQQDVQERPVYSWVISLRHVPTPPQPPLVRSWPTGQDLLRFHYGSIELAEMEAQTVFSLDRPVLLPLLPLTKGGAEHEPLLTMLERLHQRGRAELMAIGAIFVSFVYGQDNPAEQAWLERVIRDMYDIIQQTPLYQSWTRQAYAEGLKEGEQEGLERGRREGKLEGKREGQLETLRHRLVNLVQTRFPQLVSLAQTRAAQLQDPADLEALILAVSTAKQVKEARSLLRGEVQGEQEQHTS